MTLAFGNYNKRTGFMNLSVKNLYLLFGNVSLARSLILNVKLLVEGCAISIFYESDPPPKAFPSPYMLSLPAT